MPRGSRFLSIAALGAVILVSCSAPRAAERAPDSAGAGAAPGVKKPSRVTLAIGAEIDNLSSRLSGTVFAADFNFMTNSSLAVADARGIAHARLAVQLPSRDKGTWVVNPDGTMRTTWKVKPNARWHDGQTVGPRDFVFALKVALDEAMPIDNRRPEIFMDRVEPLDAKSFVVHWKTLYPRANELVSDQLEPLPEHIMGSVYETSTAEAFAGHPFWTTPDYVGSGPYRLIQWDPGTQLIYRAFDDYFLGRAKIDEVIFRIINDTNTPVANILGGEVDAAINITLGAQGGATVRNEWTPTGGGTVLNQLNRFRYYQIQFNPEYVEQPALLDVRVRRAIMHALDRDTLAEVVTAGGGRASNVYLSRNDPSYEQAAGAVPRYPHDLHRALALLQEAGWTRRGEALVNAGGVRFTLDHRVTEGTDNETEQNIMAADLRKLGMEISQTIPGKSRIRDAEYRIKFPGLNGTAFGIEVPETMRFGLADQCPDPNRRYTGGNRGCWRDPTGEYDRLYGIAATSLDAKERSDAMIRAHKIINEQVGILPLFHYGDNIAFRKGLVGPGPHWPAQGGDTWNIHEWRWE
jgi:peptide/nickel transport system substrate-binding protein